MIRLDLYLSEYGFVKSRQKAKTLIESGFVSVNSSKVLKPSFLIDETIEHNIEINDPCPYVSRGGLKLEKVLNDTQINVNGKIAIDIGASTGGFTDCLLKRGVNTVYAVDSGSNQLDKSLQDNPKVISIENYNARNIKIEDIGVLCDLITIDVSFISQTYIIPNASLLLKDDGVYVSLIKPQFEAGKDKIGKGGIVKKTEDRLFAIKRVVDCATQYGLYCSYFSESPILGGDGNVEYLAAFSKNASKTLTEADIKSIVMCKNRREK